MQKPDHSLQQTLLSDFDLETMFKSKMPLNKKRSEFRKVARAVVNTCFDKTDRTNFRDMYNGNTISHIIDHTGLELCQLIIGYGLGVVTTYAIANGGDPLRDEMSVWKSIGEAFDNKSMQQSRLAGYNTNMQRPQQVVIVA
jgi:hypothetical protein